MAEHERESLDETEPTPPDEEELPEFDAVDPLKRDEDMPPVPPE